MSNPYLQNVLNKDLNYSFLVNKIITQVFSALMRWLYDNDKYEL